MICGSAAVLGVCLASDILLLMNGFNVVFVVHPGVRNLLQEQAWFVYIPDVHNISNVAGDKTSNYVWLGMAGASIFFDGILFIGCIAKDPRLLDYACIWHYLDLGADLVIGFVSANYTTPRVNIVISETAGGTAGNTTVYKVNPYKVLLEPSTVKQVLHFAYILTRATVKCEMLGMYGKFIKHYYRSSNM